MRIAIRHETTYRYAPAVQGLGLRLRLYPTALPGQRPAAWSVRAGADEVAPMLVNGFGDSEGQWFARAPVESVTVLAEGEIETGETHGVVGRLGLARPGVFLRQTALTRPDAAIAALAEAVADDEPLARLHRLTAAVAEAILYRPGATQHGATAAEALSLGAGVCQDQTHLFIAASRHLGVPARYVVGYLHDGTTVHGETHAWAEAHLPGLGWVGFDPTHLRSPTEDYIRLCAGLDAVDAAPLRGTYVGQPEEALSVSVRVAETGAQQQ